MEKYSTQLSSLRQKIVDLPILHDPSQFEDDIYDSSDSEEDPDDYIADGHPTSAQVVEYGNDVNNRLKMKIAFQPGNEKKRLVII